MGRSATRTRRQPSSRQPTPGAQWTPSPGHVGALGALNEDELVEVLKLRPDLIEPPPRSIAELEERSLELHSVYSALLDADVLIIQLAQILTLMGERHSALTELREMTGVALSEPTLQRALTWFEDRNLVRRLDDATICVHPGLLSMRGAADLGPPARLLVGTLSVANLGHVLQSLGHKTKSNTKAVLERELLARVTDHDYVRQLVEGAPERVRVESCQLGRGSGVFQLPFDMASDPYGSLPRGAESLSAIWLIQHGLAYRESWWSAVMPQEVGLALRGGRPFPDESYQPPTPAVTGTVATTRGAAGSAATAIVGAAERLIEAWGSKPAALLKSTGIGVREVRRVVGAVGLSERETFRLVEMVAAAGLIAPDVKARLAMPTAVGDEWLDLRTAERWWALASSWLETPMYPSFAGATGPNHKAVEALGYADDFTSEARRQRASILSALLELPVGSRADTMSLTAAARWNAPMAWADVPVSPSTVVEWTLEEMAILGLAVDGALTPLARALVAGDLPAVRELLVAPTDGMSQLVLQADLTAVVTGQLPASVRTTLDLIADLESRGTATLYRFSEGSVRRAFDSGMGGHEILAFLETHAAKGVPQPLGYLVGDVERRHGEVRVGAAACYVCFEEPAQATEALRAKKTNKLELRQIAPTVLICDRPTALVLESLRAAGCFPVAEAKDGSIVHSAVVRHRAEARSPAEGGSVARAFADAPSFGPTTRWRAQVQADQSAGEDEENLRTLAAQLLRGTGTGRDAPASARRSRQPGMEHGIEIPTMLRRRALGWAEASPEHPVGLGEEIALLAREEDDSDGALPAQIVSLLGSGELDDEFDEFDGFDDELDGLASDEREGRARPSEIFRTNEEISDVLALAKTEDWPVRLSYTSAAGKTTERSVMLLSVSDAAANALVAPRWTEQRYVIDRISWARVMTPAEEEKLT